MRKLLAIRIYGRVQGVFFRQSAKEKADSLGLSGWVRNEPDGTVAAEAEGEEEKLAQFIDWCRVGPPAAGVDDLQYKMVDGLFGYKGFEIKH